MDKSNKSENESRKKLSLKKETLQHLKVRTDLRAGVVPRVAICSGCHTCRAQ
jgi:coenzyme F420-reducing hydrogenase gamma subunit